MKTIKDCLFVGDILQYENTKYYIHEVVEKNGGKIYKLTRIGKL